MVGAFRRQQQDDDQSIRVEADDTIFGFEIQDRSELENEVLLLPVQSVPVASPSHRHRRFDLGIGSMSPIIQSDSDSEVHSESFSIGGFLPPVCHIIGQPLPVIVDDGSAFESLEVAPHGGIAVSPRTDPVDSESVNLYPVPPNVELAPESQSSICQWLREVGAELCTQRLSVCSG